MGCFNFRASRSVHNFYWPETMRPTKDFLQAFFWIKHNADRLSLHYGVMTAQSGRAILAGRYVIKAFCTCRPVPTEISQAVDDPHSLLSYETKSLQALGNTVVWWNELRNKSRYLIGSSAFIYVLCKMRACTGSFRKLLPWADNLLFAFSKRDYKAKLQKDLWQGL